MGSGLVQSASLVCLKVGVEVPMLKPKSDWLSLSAYLSAAESQNYLGISHLLFHYNGYADEG